VVSAGWKKATALADNIRLLNCSFPTEVFKTGDSSVSVVTTIFLAPLDTKVRVTLALQGRSNNDGVEVGITPQVHVVYGEHFKVDRMCDYLSTRLGGQITAKDESSDVEKEAWSDIVVELQGRLLARGRK
jgi:kinetochore protein Spc7/SPC105